MTVFVDTSAFISLLITPDHNHRKAQEISLKLEKQGVHLLTTVMVIGEVLTVVSMRYNKNLALQFGERVRNGTVQLVYPDEVLIDSAWYIFRKEKNKNVSFVDCVSFAIMERYTIPFAFAFDRDYLGRGFEVLH